MYQYRPPQKPVPVRNRVATWIRTHPVWSAVIAFFVVGTAITGIAQSIAGKPSHAITPTAVPTQAQQATIAPTKVAPAITHGTPHIGGLLSDFTGKYGTANMQGVGNSETWFLSGNTIILNVRPDASGTVTYISVSGPTTWSLAQSKAACTAYLPVGASQFNAVGTLTDYHSGIGEIVLSNPGQGVCTLSIAGT